MVPEIRKITVLPVQPSFIFLTDYTGKLPETLLTGEELKFIARQKDELKKELVQIK